MPEAPLTGEEEERRQHERTRARREHERAGREAGRLAEEPAAALLLLLPG